jgi:transcriptional regulator with XRE-family HTH domain
MKRLREAKDIERKDAAAAAFVSESQIRHIEEGDSLPKPLVLRELLKLYGVVGKDEAFDELRKRALKGRDWWIGFSDDLIPAGFDLFLGMESTARQLDGWAALVPPGLAQIDEVIEAVIRGAVPDLDDDEVRRRKELRLARQHTWFDRAERGGADAPLVWWVINEGALRVPLGGTEVMSRQLLHLAELAERPYVKIQVLPTAAGAHTGVEGTFTILTAPPELESYPGCVYVETLYKPYYYEELEALRLYRNSLTGLRVKASDPEKTPALLRKMAKEL